MLSSLKFVGNTPIYKIDNTNIFVKLEKYNLGGSVKDRAVLGMLEEAKRQGKVNSDTIIVEPTSGNTGIAVAILASVLGLKAVIIMPESMSVERRKGSIDKAAEIREKYDNAISLSQFDNPANPAYHYATTAKEILEQVPDLDIFVAGVGTGGTFSGVAKYLKENKPEVLAIALEPEESPAISKGHGGVHKIQGIGTGFIPENFNKELMDEIYTVSSDEAINETKNFVRTTGIGVGISSGAAIAGAKKVAAKYPDKKIVTILPDGVDKYLSMLEFDEVTYVEV